MNSISIDNLLNMSDTEATSWLIENHGVYTLVEESELKTAIVIIKAVAHIGIDFGHGKFELQQEHIDMARAILEQNDMD